VLLSERAASIWPIAAPHTAAQGGTAQDRQRRRGREMTVRWPGRFCQGKDLTHVMRRRRRKG
jgi:hypothetical protein